MSSPIAVSSKIRKRETGTYHNIMKEPGKQDTDTENEPPSEPP